MNHKNLHFTFELDGQPADTFAVIKFSGEESLSTPYAFEIELASRREDITPEQIVEKSGTLRVWRNGLIEKRFHGIVSRFVQGNSGHHHTFYSVSLVPALLRSSLRQNSRIFQQMNIEDIISLLLNEMGTTDFIFDLTSPLQEREFCVQYRETDLAFIQRLAAEEGIYYHFLHTGSSHTLRFTDSTQTAPPLEKALPYHATAGGDAPSTYVHSFTRKTQIKSTKAEMKDYSFKKPTYSFLHDCEGTEMEYQQGPYEHYDFPGRYKSDAQGKPFTKYKLEHLRSDAITAVGKSNISQVNSGMKFDLEEHPDDLCNRDWLTVSVHHTGEQPQAVEEHGGFHPSKVTAGSGTVFMDGKPAGRVGDPLEPHDKPKNPKHGRSIATGSSTVFIDGKPAALTGGKVSCGGITIGSGTVNIADTVDEAGEPKLAPMFNRKFILTDKDGTPIPNMEYKLELDTGEVITGTSTMEGETDFAYSKDAPIGIKVFTRIIRYVEE